LNNLIFGSIVKTCKTRNTIINNQNGGLQSY